MLVLLCAFTLDHPCWTSSRTLTLKKGLGNRHKAEIDSSTLSASAETFTAILYASPQPQLYALVRFSDGGLIDSSWYLTCGAS